MADRGLSAGVITALGAETVEFYHLVRIDFSTPLYYTTAPYDIDYGGNTYLSTDILGDIPAFTESLKIKPTTLKFKMSGVSTAVHAITLSNAYKNSDFYIYLHEVSTGTATQMFKGSIDSFETTEGDSKSDVIWTVANHWSDWEAVNGRYLTDANQQLLFSSDLGLEFATTTPPLIDWWGNTQGYIYNSWYNADQAGTKSYTTTLFDYTTKLNAMIMAYKELDFDESGDGKLKLQVLYGQDIVQGIPVFRGISGASNEYLWVVYALAEGECEDLIDITFDGKSYKDAELSPYITMVKATNWHSGSDTQTVDTTLNADTYLTQWTSAHRLRGICYCAIRYTFNATVWSGGEPQPIFELKGKKILDPRTSTTAYSTNSALVSYDYILNSTYGKSLISADTDDFNAGATYCETLETNHNGGRGGTPASINLFDFNGVLQTSNSIKKNVEAILFTMRASLPWVNGKYKLVIERDDDSGTFEIDSNNFKGSINVKHGTQKAMLNTLTYGFTDAANNYEDAQIIEESSSYLTEDNNRVHKKAIKNLFEKDRYRATNRTSTILKRSRSQTTVVCNMSNAVALRLEPGDIANMTLSTRSWSSKPFRIEEMTITKDLDIKLKLREFVSTDYDWSVPAETDPAANDSLLDPFTVVAPTSLVLTSGTAVLFLNEDGTIISQIKVEFTASVDAYVTGYNIYTKKPSDATKVLYARIDSRDKTDLLISPVEDGILYEITVIAVNALGIESSSLVGAETVVGKTAAPENVTGFVVAQNGGVVVLKWDQVSDLDLAGYEIRYGKAGETSWASASPLTSVTRGTNVTSADIPPGDWDIYIKAVDTTGNYSTTETSTSITITTTLDTIAQNEQSPDFSGTLVNFVKHHTGKLAPKSQNLASADGWDTFDIFVINPYQICTYEAAEIDIGFDDVARVWGSIESSLGFDEIGVANPALSIDYKLASGSYDGFEDWSIGDVELRYCKHKLTLDTDIGVAYISGFLPTVDQLEHTQKATNVALVSGVNTVTFSNAFHVAPFVKVEVVGSTAIFSVIDNITTTTFDVRLFTSAGAATAGTINYEASGI